MTNQPHDHDPRRFQPQFPDTPEGQQAKRELAAWTAQYRKEAALMRERDELRERLKAYEALSVIGDLSRTVASLQEQVREKDAQIRELQREQRNHQDTNEHEQLVLPNTPEREKRARVPQIKAWRTYDGFRDNMRDRERNRRLALTKAELDDMPIRLEDLADQTGSDSLKTIERTMESYGLDVATAGLPSTWPDRPSRIGPGHHLAAVIAAAFIFGLAEIIFDRGPLDGVVHMVRLLGCNLGAPL